MFICASATYMNPVAQKNKKYCIHMKTFNYTEFMMMVKHNTICLNKLFADLDIFIITMAIVILKILISKILVNKFRTANQSIKNQTRKIVKLIYLLVFISVTMLLCIFIKIWILYKWPRGVRTYGPLNNLLTSKITSPAFLMSAGSLKPYLRLAWLAAFI